MGTILFHGIEDNKLTNSVNVFIYIVRHVIVYHMLNIRNVQPSSCNRSSHQNLVFSHSKIVKSFLPLPLCSISMDTSSGPALSRQICRQIISTSFLPYKYDSF